jgi:alanyl-tRNA synthetase
MGEAFSQLESEKGQISRVIEQEERAFLNTLGKGMKLVEKTVEELSSRGTKLFPGSDAFTLYDTFGFPIDLTQLILREREMDVDLAGFETEMSKQKARSRSDAAKEIDDWVVINETGLSKFTGYNKTSDVIQLSKYRKVVSKGSDIYHLVFDKTPFYAESGGQIGDTGYLEQGDEKIEIFDTIKENNLIIHLAKSLPKNSSAPLKATVDSSRRESIAKNHSATHLLHYALKRVLGIHAEQKGSLVNEEKLRFDFSHFEKVTNSEIKEIEKIVNGIIRQNLPVIIDLDVPIEEAKSRGAAAQFGEKYDELVRVVTFGDSIELCGGTHIESTGTLGLFKILNEGAIAAGIRRIEAITSDTAYNYIETKLESLEEIESLLKNPKDLTESIEKLIGENQLLRKKNEKISAEVASFISKELSSRIEKIGKTDAIIAHIKADSIDMMKEIASQIRNREVSILLAIGAEIDGKAALVVTVGDNLLKDKKIEAGKIIREVSSEIDGGGGGQPFLATAGGKNPDGIDKALQKVRSILELL